MKTNYHTHTSRCKHASGSAKDYLLNAIEKNISILGFSDHAPFKDELYESRMDFCELEEYINDVTTLKKEYSNKIDIKCGLEIEYIPSKNWYYKELLNNYDIDYLVLGQHFFTDSNGNFTNTYLLKDSSKYIEYAKVAIKGMETGFFKFLAHPDVVFINDLPWDKNCEKFCDILINSAKQNDFILEFNANGIRKGEHNFCDGFRYSYPHKEFWYKVAKNNIKVIINSDCHKPEYVWDSSMDKAYDMAKSIGLNIINKIF